MMSQVIKSGNVLKGKKKQKKNIFKKNLKNIIQLDGLDKKSQILYSTTLFYRQQCKSESLRILKPFLTWTVEVSSKAP